MTAPVTRAYVNHGRWIIECACGNAVEAQGGEKQWRCAPPDEWPADSPGFCGAKYSVAWPDTKRIMAILNQRPRVSNQNWIPGETVAALITENLEHGCEVPG